MEVGEGHIVEGERITLSDKQAKAQKQRNVAVALALVAFVLVFYIGTMMKLGVAENVELPTQVEQGQTGASATGGSS